MTKPLWTSQQIVAQLTNWEARWSTATAIPYTFYTQAYGFLGATFNFSAFSGPQRAAVMRNMELVSDVANIAFVNVADNGTVPGVANPRIGFYNNNSVNVPYWGVAQDYVTASETVPYGQIYAVNSAVNLYRANAQGGWTIGESNPRKLMHELLHTIGLDHPGPYNGDRADYESQALFYQDSQQYTVMSYWLAGVTGADHETGGIAYCASTPLLYDVASLQYLYGANLTTRTGDTVYGFHSTAGREVFDLSLHPQSVFTIWDAGGRDTLDLSGYAAPSVIDLHQGAFMDAGGLTDNMTIAFGAVIEQAIGGAGGDLIAGNDVTNRLSGGGGADVFVYTGADAQMWTPRSDGKKMLPDFLADFTSGTDRIDLSAIDANGGTAANEAFHFIGTAAFGHVAGELRWEVVAGRSWIMADMDGNGLADLQITTASQALTAADFIL
jgi:serralysin